MATIGAAASASTVCTPGAAAPSPDTGTSDASTTPGVERSTAMVWTVRTGGGLIPEQADDLPAREVRRGECKAPERGVKHCRVASKRQL